MAKRMDVVAPRKYTKDGQEKTAWNKIGSVWIDGDKMRLNLESIPVGWDGFALISEPKEKDAPRQAERPQRGNPRDDFEDAPF